MLAPPRDWKRVGFLLLGIALFFGMLLAPEIGDAVDPAGRRFPLTAQGKAALGLFLFAAIWWVTEVLPIGGTATAIGVLRGGTATQKAVTDAVARRPLSRCRSGAP